MTDPIANALPKVMQTIRSASALAAQDVNFYRSIDTDLALELDDSSKGLFDLASRLIASAGEDPAALTFGKDNIESESSWKPVAGVLDSLFEKIEVAMDAIRKPAKSSMTYLDDGKVHQPQGKIDRPQDKFTSKIDNSEKQPFKPKLTLKPHALKPLDEVLQLTTPVLDPQAAADTAVDPPFYPQPYATEIDTQPYPESILQKAEPIPSKDWESTSATWVETPAQLKAMVDELKSTSEIAVDLEHHDYRTYYGLVCLMQVSSRERDWIVDTLALRDQLQPLNEVFANPMIVKVFHGAFMDIIWLQRDLGLYVVSLFDTYHASKALGFPKFSLAYLLETFANFKTSKKYQLADWRVRPIEGPMLAYARSDTHFLLHIYDILRNKLLDADKMSRVLADSRLVARRRFEYTKFRPLSNTKDVSCPIMAADPLEPYRNIMVQYNVPWQQKPLVELLYNWRDNLARETDESPRYIMSNQLLVALATLQAPIDERTVLAVPHLSEHVRAHVRDLSRDLAVCAAGIVAREENQVAEAEESVDVADISEYGACYAQLRDSKLAILAPASDLLVASSSLYSSTASEYTYDYDVKSKQVTKHNFSQEFIERLQSTMAGLRELEESLKQEEEDEEEEEENEEEEEQEQVTKPAAPSTAVIDKEADKDEVVAIRKKTVHKPKKKQAEQPDSFVDYANADKIVLEERPRTENKKRAFNPYGKSAEGPRPSKRSKRVVLGKSSTFRR